MYYEIAAAKNKRGHPVRVKSIDREPLSVFRTMNRKGSLSAGSRALKAEKTNAQLHITTIKNNRCGVVFFGV